MRKAACGLLCSLVASGLGLDAARAQTALTCTTTAQELSGEPGATIDVSCPAGCQPAPVWGTDVYSDDSSVCTAARHAGTIDSSGGGVTVRIQGGQSEYVGSTRNGVTTAPWDAWGRSFEVLAPAATSDPPAGPVPDATGGTDPTALACNQNAQDLAVDPGSPLAVSCPAGCGSGSVWGSGLYTDDSSICAAAMHAGVVGVDGGSFSLEIAAGQPHYDASTRNGVSTLEWGEWARSFTFPEADPTVPIQSDSQTTASTGLRCEQSAQELAGELGTAWEVTCPAGCAAPIWGTQVYSDDSSVCTAAVHAGALGSEGGVVGLVIGAGRPAYAASSRNGITSLEWGEWGRSFAFPVTSNAPLPPDPDPTAPVRARALECAINGWELGDGWGPGMVVTCPADCAPAPIWGTYLYAYDSSVCTAAMHTGVIDARGGIFSIWYQGTQAPSTPWPRNGISSAQYPEWTLSFQLGTGLAALNEAVDGSWSGTAAGIDGDETWSVAMSVDRFAAVGEIAGSIAYPTRRCGGTLTRQADVDGRFVFLESILYGEGRCAPGGSVHAVPTAVGGGLVWDYHLADGTRAATAVLARSESPMCATTASSVAGEWTGTAHRLNGEGTYAINVGLMSATRVGDLAGWIRSPTLGCYGLLERSADEGGQFSFVEYDSTCATEGSMRISMSPRPLTGECQLAWEAFAPDGTRVAASIMTRR